MNAGLVSKVPEALTDTVGAFFVAEKQPRQLVTHCQNKVTHNAQTTSKVRAHAGSQESALRWHHAHLVCLTSRSPLMPAAGVPSGLARVRRYPVATGAIPATPTNKDPTRGSATATGPIAPSPSQSTGQPARVTIKTGGGGNGSHLRTTRMPKHHPSSLLPRTRSAPRQSTRN